MIVKISSPQDLGLLIRAVRKHEKLRLDDVAGCAKVGHIFLREVERGKQTVQLGRVMQVLAELGIFLCADIQTEIQPAFESLKQTGVKPLKPRPTRNKSASQNQHLGTK